MQELETKKAEAEELLKRIEGLSKEEKQIILAGLKGMLLVSDYQEKKGA